MSEVVQQLTENLRKGEQVSFRFQSYTRDINSLTLNLVSQALSMQGLPYLQSAVTNIVKELINNAEKANLKRILCRDMGLDINNSDDYRKLTKDFPVLAEKLLFIENEEHLKYEERIRVLMQINQGGLEIAVLNNSEMLEVEAKRAEHCITLTKESETAGDAIMNMDEDLMGSMGLLMNIMLMKKTGIPVDNFSLESSKGRTRALLKIPGTSNKPENALVINKIMNEIKTIPMFPETTNKILYLCDSENSNMEEVSAAIERDPGLASEVLKIANSGGYITQQKDITSILAATKILGIRPIREMVMAAATNKILDQKYAVFAGFWEHSFQAAFYSKLIAEKKGFKAESDTVYMAGLLHDLGKIVLAAVEPEIISEINGIQVSNISRESSTIEEISLGISHAEIGARMAERWNFSPALTQTIRYHHYPFSADKEHKASAYIVHLADALIQVEADKGAYVYVDHDVTEILGIDSRENLIELHEMLQESFKIAEVEKSSEKKQI